MTANLINDGKIIEPRIVKPLSTNTVSDNSIKKFNSFKIEHLNIIKKSMYSAR